MEPNTPTGQKPAFIQTSCPNCFLYWLQKPVVNWHIQKSGQNVSCCVQNYDTVNCKYARAKPAFYSSSCLILHKATTGSRGARVFQQRWTKKCKLVTKSKSGLLVGATVQNVVWGCELSALEWANISLKTAEQKIVVLNLFYKNLFFEWLISTNISAKQRWAKVN